jgi:hypothetical protein
VSKDDIRAGATNVGLDAAVTSAFYNLLNEAMKRARELRARTAGPGEVSALDEAAVLYHDSLPDAARQMIARKASEP